MIDIKIPGWNTRNTLTVLAGYASAVPENGTILELGGFFGRTSYTLGMAKLPSVKLITVDWWRTYHLRDFVDIELHDNQCGFESLRLIEQHTRFNPDRIEGDDFLSLWKHYTRDIINNEYIRSNTSLCNLNFPLIDFIYHDAGHSYDEVYSDLNHWFPKLKDTGICILDDYMHHQFPGLVTAVDQFVSENNLYTEMVTERNILLRRK